MPAELRFSPIEIEQIHANINELMAETMRLHAEAIKPVSIRKHYRVVVAASVLTSVGIALGLALSVVL